MPKNPEGFRWIAIKVKVEEKPLLELAAKREGKPITSLYEDFTKDLCEWVKRTYGEPKMTQE